MVVGIPAGGSDDLTVRGLHAVTHAEVIVTDDFKMAARLLRHHNLSTTIVGLDPNDRSAAAEITARIRDGQKVVVLLRETEFDTQSPAAALITEAHRAGLAVRVVPSPGEITGALVAAGLPYTSFSFVGDLSRLPRERRESLAGLAARGDAVVIRESPTRLRSLLAALAEEVPDRPAAVVSNLGTPYEAVIRGTTSNLPMRTEGKSLQGGVFVVLGTATVVVPEQTPEQQPQPPEAPTREDNDDFVE